MKKEYSMIDIFKFIFAIAVVVLHSKIFSNNTIISWLITHGILRLAVPFFFCASGYFLYKSLESNKETKTIVKRYVKRLLIPFVFWCLLNLPLFIMKYVAKGDNFKIIILKIIRGLIFYPWGSMWYIHALIIAVLLIIPFYKKKKLTYAIPLGIVLYMLGLLLNTYYFVISSTSFNVAATKILSIVSSPRNGFTEGFIFVALGMFLAEKTIDKTYNKKNNLVLPLLYLLFIVEIVLTKNLAHKDDHSLFIMLLPLIPSFFYFLTQFKINTNTKILRNYSSGIYFSQRFVIDIVSLLLIPYNAISAFIITITIILIVLSILYKLNNKYINYVIK